MQKPLKVHLPCVWKPNQKDTYRGMIILRGPSPSSRITRLNSFNQHRENQFLSAVVSAVFLLPKAINDS